ncbi:BamA/TamA family outer membrane protein [Flavobacterium sp. SaA2.13]|uniref:BamA/OMP85 family outer membrane protein n=1 Tax=Flavobacterium TaxID=237 RepID=UPI00178C7C85|nr:MULTISPECIES: POTRA domain-containing protein [Flavobacterium]MBE1615476.1 BamA/TamA family outer membrane protein [Flavobacterium sp. SaA2.13]
MKQLSVIKKENADLEKPVNKLNKPMFQKSIQLLFGFLLLATGNIAFAQETNGLEPGKEYILADITVSGKISYNENTVLTFTGLEKGQTIHVPGEEISTAIKKLWQLGLFNDINFYANKIEGDSLYLELNLNELPKLSDVKMQGVRKGKRESLIKDTQLTKGTIVNENLVTNTKNYIENKYKKDGFYKAKVAINVIPDSTNTVKMVVNIDKGKKVRISDININGNEQLSDRKIKKAMKKTKEKGFPNPLRIFSPSKFTNERYKEDLANVVEKYKEKGYRDARITSDTVVYNPKNNKVAIDLTIEEGKKYYFGEIKFLGNSVYTNQELNRILGIKKGDVYNGVLLQKRIADKDRPDGEDITNLYQNNGYLFSNINAVEVRTANDTIDFEIRITEGPIAYFNNITVVGNDKTNDHVIYRELTTRPGQKWNKEEVVNTVRGLGTLGFFDPETIRPDVKNPDPASGTVDVEWHVTEKGSSQIELQGGYGGGGFIGTLGLSFNNFSMRNLFKKDAYKPIPMGDGQKLSLRAQGSTYFQTYSFSFTEPWLGGKKPIQFFSSLSHSRQFLYNFQTRDVNRSQSFTISSITMGLAKRLSGISDRVTLSHSLTFQYYNLNNYNTGLFTFGDGSSRNLAYTIELSRDNRGNSLIYPIYGSLVSVSFRTTLPYSYLNGINYGDLENQEKYKLRNNGEPYQIEAPDGSIVQVPEGAYLDEDGYPVASFQEAAADPAKVDQKKFNWLEYYKVKFKADWYTRLYDKLVFRSLAEFGFMGAYNSERGLVPFERFFLGGDGLANFALDGREVIQLRGYPNQALSSNDGGTVYNKFSLELRYPITLKPQASIYVLTFAEAGASYDEFADYNPFALKRSAGFGLRVFMPAFGLLGIDFGHGFDPLPGGTQKNGWETHFIIGQQF